MAAHEAMQIKSIEVCNAC